MTKSLNAFSHMNKAQLVAKLEKHRADKAILVEALTRIRQGSRDCVPKGSTPNPVWIIEKVTEALTKVEP